MLTDRFLWLAILLIGAPMPGCTNVSNDSQVSEATGTNQDAPKLATYTLRASPNSGPKPTFDMAVMAGSIVLSNGCVMLQNAEQSVLLIFPIGVTTLDGNNGILFEGTSFYWGDAIEVGGSASGGSAVNEIKADRECEDYERWVVAPSSMRKR